MNDHLTIDHGHVVESRHLTLVPVGGWPDESDTDQYYENPVGVAVVLCMIALVAMIGFLGWAAT